MDLTALAFYLFAFITLVAACVVVFSKNIVHSAFSLLFAFFGVAGLYVLLMADFLAVTQLVIYVGGILVLVIFGVMLTNKVIDVQIKTGTVQVLPAIVVVGALTATLLIVFSATDWKLIPQPKEIERTGAIIGEQFLTTYVLPFEIASVVLLVALIGAAMIARREKKV